MSLVLERNQDLRLEKYRVESARLDFGFAQGSRAPRLELDSRFGREHHSGSPFPDLSASLLPESLFFARPGGITGDAWGNTGTLVQPFPWGGRASFSHGLYYVAPEGIEAVHTYASIARIAQPLLKGFGAGDGIAYAYRIAALDREISVVALKEQVLRVLSGAREAYWDLLLRTRQLAVMRADAEYWNSLNKSAQASKKLGMMAEDDYLRIRINALAAEQAILEAEFGIRKARLELMRFADLRDTAALSAMPEDMAIPPALPGLETLLEEAQRNAPVVRRLAAEERKARQLRDRSWNRRLPLLDLHGEWIRNWKSGGSRDYRIGVAASYSFPDLGGGHDYRAALIAGKSVAAEQSRAAADLRTTLELTSLEFGKETENRKLAEQRLELESLRNRIARKRFQIGELDVTELNLAQKDLLAAQQDFLLSTLKLMTMHIEVEKSTGRALAHFPIDWDGGGR